MEKNWNRTVGVFVPHLRLGPLFASNLVNAVMFTIVLYLGSKIKSNKFRVKITVDLQCITTVNVSFLVFCFAVFFDQDSLFYLLTIVL